MASKLAVVFCAQGLGSVNLGVRSRLLLVGLGVFEYSGSVCF